MSEEATQKAPATQAVEAEASTAPRPETSFTDAQAPAAGQPRPEAEAPDAPEEASEAAAGPEGAEAPVASEAPMAPEAPVAPEGPAAPEAPEAPAVAQVAQAPAAAAGDEAARYLALAQRTQADFENFRKRMARENAVAAERGVAKLAKALLPALDHLELAVKAAEGHEDVVKGFAIVRDEFVAALGKAGIQAYSPRGEAFDPMEHEAMASQPAPEGTESGTVLEVYQQGYRINGTVLRPARVVVAG